MARAPIIISNGGMAEILAKHSIDREAEKKIKENVDKLNDETSRDVNVKSNAVASWIKWDNNKKAPFIIWHIKGEDLSYFFSNKYPDLGYTLEEIPDPDRLNEDETQK